MKCGLHSRKTVLEHPLCPSRKYSVFSWEISFARLDHQRVYIMFMHVYALFIHVLPILGSNNKFHGLLYSFRRSLETMHQWLSTADHFWCGLFDPSKEFKGCALQQGCLDLFKSTMDDFKGSKHSEHGNLIQSDYSLKVIFLSSRFLRPIHQRMRSDDSKIMLHP